MKDSTCLLSTLKADTDDKKFNLIFEQELEKRNFKAIWSGKVVPGRFYLLMKRERIGHGLYKDCRVTLQMKKAEKNFQRKKDKTIHEREVQRKYPRITREGNERCRKALKEAFVNIPTCVKPE